MEKLNERLKEARKKANYTQDQIAIKLNTTRSTISKYESGMLEPNIQILKEMIKYYKTSADYILNINTKEENKLTEEEQEIINDWKQLNDTHKNIIKAAMKAAIEDENIKEGKKSAV